MFVCTISFLQDFIITVIHSGLTESASKQIFKETKLCPKLFLFLNQRIWKILKNLLLFSKIFFPIDEFFKIDEFILRMSQWSWGIRFCSNPVYWDCMTFHIRLMKRNNHGRYHDHHQRGRENDGDIHRNIRQELAKNIIEWRTNYCQTFDKFKFESSHCYSWCKILLFAYYNNNFIFYIFILEKT